MGKLELLIDDVLGAETQNMLIEAGGEITSEIEQKFTALLEKVDSCEWFLTHAESKAEDLKEKAKQFTQAAKILENATERLKIRIKEKMLSSDIKELSGNDFRFAIAQRQPKLEYRQEWLTPEFLKPVTPVPMEVDKDKLMAALKEGRQVYGCYLREVWALTRGVRK